MHDRAATPRARQSDTNRSEYSEQSPSPFDNASRISSFAPFSTARRLVRQIPKLQRATSSGSVPEKLLANCAISSGYGPAHASWINHLGSGARGEASRARTPCLRTNENDRGSERW